MALAVSYEPAGAVKWTTTRFSAASLARLALDRLALGLLKLQPSRPGRPSKSLRCYHSPSGWECPES